MSGIRKFTKDAQRGQAMVLIAITFVGLAAFIGLTVDAGILFAQYGHLRRGVDAAALGAANQYRVDVSYDEMEESAQQYLELNNLDHATASLKVCNTRDTGTPVGSRPYHDNDLCPAGYDGSADYTTATERFEKLVEVEADLPVEFAFLQIIGFDGVTIRAGAEAEAASLDLVLTIDTSESMSYDGPDGEDTDPATCNPTDSCEPFRDVRQAAKDFVDEMFFPFDRIAVVSFAHIPDQHIALEPHHSLPEGTTAAAVKSAIDTLEVQASPTESNKLTCACYWDDCDGDSVPDGNLGGCQVTNVADGLELAGVELANYGDEEAVWVVVLLGDGAANQARNPTPTNAPIDDWYCPGSVGNPTWVQPYCRDDDPTEGNFPDTSSHGAYGFDAEDAARAAGFTVGCHANADPDQSTWCDTEGVDGIGSLIFTIGLGDKLTNDPDSPGFPNAGEELMRRIAATGDDGDPTTNPCSAYGVGTSCGNYYFAATTADLDPAFDAIAERIFTRITR
ncbi:MAG: hypothetical protein ACLFWD_09930 [Anaerolineales bacterium]